MPTGAPSPRRQGGARRPATIAAGLVVLILSGVVAWQVVAVAQSRRLADSAPEEALAWRPHDPDALSGLAEREFIDVAPAGGNTDAARAAARDALQAGPLEVRAIRVLGWIADNDGDNPRALRLMTLAASRSQRDVSSHLWMFHNRLGARDFNAAFAHGDALLRNGATFREAAVLMSSAAGADDAAATALARRLATGPAWRIPFVRELSASQDPDVTLSILLAVKEAGVAIMPEESAAVAGRLIRMGRLKEAYLAWVLLLPPAGYDVLDNVFDGGFEGQREAGQFAWSFSGETVQIAQAPGRPGKALVVQSGVGKSRILAGQMLVLPPGTYRLTMIAQQQGLGDGAMEWVVTCAGGRSSDPPLGRLIVPNSDDWAPLSATFTVPGACDAQRLALRNGGKGRAAATGWFDDIRVELAGQSGAG